jgi:hypothetical protein
MIGGGYFSLRATPNFSFKQNIYEHPRPPGGRGVKILLLHLPHMILLTQWTQQDVKAIFYLLILVAIHFLLRLLKGTLLEPIYRIWCLFWVVLFGVFMANYLKKELKEWWNE